MQVNKRRGSAGRSSPLKSLSRTCTVRIIEAERSIENPVLHVSRRSGDTRTERLPSSRAELSRPRVEHVR